MTVVPNVRPAKTLGCRTSYVLCFKVLLPEIYQKLYGEKTRRGEDVFLFFIVPVMAHPKGYTRNIPSNPRAAGGLKKAPCPSRCGEESLMKQARSGLRACCERKHVGC